MGRKAHQEKDAKAKDAEEVKPGAVPAYLLDREQVRRTKVRYTWSEGRGDFLPVVATQSFFYFLASLGFHDPI